VNSLERSIDIPALDDAAVAALSEDRMLPRAPTRLSTSHEQGGTEFGAAVELSRSLVIAMATRPSIAHYTANLAEYETAVQSLFAAMEAGAVRASGIATKAHEDLEARRTRGSVILVP
jgi:hypothetical protein